MVLRRRQRASTASTYKLCSVLLSYPDQELLDGRGELCCVAEELAASPARDALERFCAWWRDEDALALQQHYVSIFDLERRCGLYLTFYGEGDRRERGSALLRLKRLYRAAGLPLEGSELPDYLPVMLEFAAAAPSGRGAVVFREHRAALELLRTALHERATPYAHVLEAVCVTVGDMSPSERARALALAASGPPHELVGLEPFAPPEVMPTTEPRR